MITMQRITLCILLSLCAPHPLAHGETSPTRLDWIDVVSRGELSTQVMINFSAPVQCKRSINKEKHQITLTFPGVTLENFDHQMVSSKLDILKKDGFAENITIGSMDNGNGVHVVVTFAPHREVVDPQTKAVEQRINRFLVKCCSFNQRFILDIFTEEALHKIKTNDSFIKLASNDVQQFDYKPAFGPLGHYQPIKPLRIMIDPGHGGDDRGAQSHLGTWEKDIALDVSKQVYKMLKKKGHRVFLTRSADVQVPLAQRAELAAQLKADFFVSIHVNSAGKLNSKSSGIETFYYQGKEILDKKNVGFMFVNYPKDMQLLNTLNQNTRKMLNTSYNLASSIQESLVNTLKQNYGPVQNRGTKPESFRCFLQNHIPASLVEIGFLTNTQEAERLATPSYRSMVAKAIADGVGKAVHSLCPVA